MAAVLLAGCVAACAAPAQAVDLDTLKQNYVDQQYGMFLHFSMATYTNQQWANPGQNVNLFNPTLIDTDQWATVAKNAEMKYGVLTAKHIDGFALWDTGQSTYDIASTSWYNNSADSRYRLDIVKSYTDSFRKAGLGVGLYYSIWDQQAGIGPAISNSTYRPAQLSSAAAITYIKSQLHDLLTNYGHIQVLWLDGFGGRAQGVNFSFYEGTCSLPVNTTVPTIPYATIRDYVRSISPETVIVNDSGKEDTNLTDIMPYEQTLPSGGNNLPSEACDCMRSDLKWFWNTPGATEMRAANVVGARTAFVNACNGAYLLDVPPDKTGLIPDNATTGKEVTALGAIKTYLATLRPGNLAIAKKATQSSSSTNGSTTYSAGMAVDGDRLNVARTAIGDYNPSWKIDLGKATAIGEVNIYSDPSYAGRLRDITIQILAADGTTVVYTSSLLNPGNVLSSGTASYTSGPTSLVVSINGGSGVVGEFIRILRMPEAGYATDGTGNKYLLDAAEVEVFAPVPEPAASALWCIGATGLAAYAGRKRK